MTRQWKFLLFDGPRRYPLAPITTPGLTKRELEVLKYAGYLLDSDLSELLGINQNVIHKHLRSARIKAGAYAERQAWKAARNRRVAVQCTDNHTRI